MSLTLQDVAGLDKAVVWCLRTHSEGVNLVSNGTFDSGSNWTANADWAISGGSATYTYSTVVAADLDQTLTAVSAVAYVLEYEITAITGSGFTLSIIGGGSAIIATTLIIPITVGFHRVNLFGVATKTLLRFHTAGFFVNDVLSMDNVKLRKVDETAYLSTVDLS